VATPLVVPDDIRTEIQRFVIETYESGENYTLGELWDLTGRLVPIEDIDEWIEDKRREKRDLPPAMPDSTIVGCFGPRGSGKSLLVTWLAWQRYCQGFPVFYNPKGLLTFPPRKGGVCEFLSLKDLAMLELGNIERGFVFWDEIQRSLSKFRASTTASFLLNGALQQTRKLGLDLGVTSNAVTQLDGGLTEQLNIHGKLDGKLEWRLKKRIPNGDYVIVQWTDTHGVMGKGPNRFVKGAQIDNRIRLPRRISHLSDMFPLYNTKVIADPLEVLGLTADEMRLAGAERDSGIGRDDLAKWIRFTLVPDLVKAGATLVLPDALADTYIPAHYERGYDHSECCGSDQTERDILTIHAQTGMKVKCSKGERVPITIDPALLVGGLKKAGLKSRGGRTAALQFMLPPAEMIPQFQAGLWNPED